MGVVVPFSLTEISRAVIPLPARTTDRTASRGFHFALFRTWESDRLGGDYFFFFFVFF